MLHRPEAEKSGSFVGRRWGCSIALRTVNTSFACAAARSETFAPKMTTTSLAEATLDPAGAVHTPRAETTDPTLEGRRVGSGALWSALNAGTVRVATFAVTLVVARLVAPHELGVFTVAVTVFSIALSFAELGVSSAIVREHQRSREIAPTVFTISLVNGALLALVVFLSAPFLARQLGAADATSAVRVLSLVLLMSGFSAVPKALMSRDFMQRQRFVIDASFLVSSTVVMLVIVLLGHPVMGLAISRVVGHLVTVVMIMWMAPERYWPGFRWREAKPLLSFGLPLAGSNLLTLAIANVDFVIVGHLLGATQLGFYNLAFGISGWPVTIFSAVLISVTLPTLSRVQNSARELTRHLNAGLAAIASVAFPVCALSAALAGPLIDTVYGPRWHPAWTALVVLSIFGAARTILTLFSDLSIALGLTRRLLAIQLIWMLALTPAMVVGVSHWGIAGAGFAHAVVVVGLVIPLYAITVRRSTPIAIRHLRHAVLRPLVASVAAAGVAFGASYFLDESVWKLLVGTTLGLITYLLLARRWLTDLQRRLKRMYWGSGRRARGRHSLRHEDAAGQQAPSAAKLLGRHGRAGPAATAGRYGSSGRSSLQEPDRCAS